jgi:hypothetical protein
MIRYVFRYSCGSFGVFLVSSVWNELVRGGRVYLNWIHFCTLCEPYRLSNSYILIRYSWVWVREPIQYHPIWSGSTESQMSYSWVYWIGGMWVFRGRLEPLAILGAWNPPRLVFPIAHSIILNEYIPTNRGDAWGWFTSRRGETSPLWNHRYAHWHCS